MSSDLAEGRPTNAASPSARGSLAAEPPATPLPLRFDLREVSGSLGDLGTFLPIAVALAATSGMDLAAILLFAGLMNVATGVVFRQPIAVQPMKAVAAIAIAMAMPGGSIAAAGLIMGLILLALGVFNLADRLANWVPVGAVRGIQLGVGVKLAWSSVSQIGPADTGELAVFGLVSAVLIAAVLVPSLRRWPVLLVVVIIGLGWAAMDAHVGLAPGLPINWALPAADQWTAALTTLVPAQLPLTLLNSLLAVCLLSEDLYPGRGVGPKRMAASVGLMNLIACPLGGMPMCHGAGGLAAQHAFGARTGGSVVILGGVKIVAGILLGASAVAILGNFPPALLASLLLIAGLRLAYESRRATRAQLPLAIAVAALTYVGWVLPSLLLIIAAALWMRPASSTIRPADGCGR